MIHWEAKDAAASAAVAAGILPAVEPGFQPGGKIARSLKHLEHQEGVFSSSANPGGKMPPSTAGRMPAATTTADLRRLSPAELEQLGQQSLREHLLAQAVVAHQKHGPVTADKLEALLHDPDCLRHPVRLVFEFGEMAMHQFAQPDIDWRNTEQDGRVLYLRPLLRERPDLLPLAVAYMIPAINYGDIVTDEHCLSYGATLLGMMEDEYYEKLCALCGFLGAEVRPATPAKPTCCN